MLSPRLLDMLRATRSLQSIFSLLLFAFIHFSYAQSLKFQHIGVEQGLSQDIVTGIAQDSLGFMWFGTEDGLNRYDGYNIITFKHDPRDSNSLPTSIIGSLMTDSRGRLWIATTGGCRLMDPGTLTLSKPGPAGGVQAFCEGKDSVIWLSGDTSLYRYDSQGNLERVVVPERWQPAHTIFFDKQHGLLFAGSDAGPRIYSVMGDTLIAERGTRATEAFEGRNPGILFRTSTGDFLLASSKGGLHRLTHNLEIAHVYQHEQNNPQSLSDNRVLVLAEDHQRRLWVGTFSGLDLIDRTSWQISRQRNGAEGSSLRGDRVYALCVDRTGALWVGTYRGGVNRLDPLRQRFAHVAYDPNGEGGLPARNVFSILETDNGDLWVGTENGLFRKQEGRFRQYKFDQRRSHSLSSNVVISLCQRSNGELWVGCEDGVANRYEPASDRFTRFALPTDGPGNVIRTLYETKNGLLIAGTESRGAYLFDSNQKRFVKWNLFGDSGGPAGVWSAYEDKSGVLWLGTFYLPYVVRFASGKGEPQRIYSDPRREGALANPSIRTYCEAGDMLYLGTWGGGFARYDRRTDQYVWYLEVSGLPSLYVKAMQSDAQGRIWIATEKGLSRFDPRTESFRAFTMEDGLQSNFFWSGSTCKGKGGRLYFGGTNGFNVFHPDSIAENRNVPPVVITSMRILDRPTAIPSDRTINLTYQADFFSFEFVALDYTFPERNQYAYMLEGFDKDWVQAGTRRYAAYTHLDPGKYVFRVRGSNSDGVWNETGTSLSIIIAPPYWMTWWFRGLLLMAISASLYGLYRYRLQQALKVERLRQQIGQDLHDDIGTNLSAIVIASQVIRKQQQASSDVLNQVGDIGGIALKTQEHMRDIVWMLNPKNDTLKEFVARMKHEASRLLKTVDWSFSSPDGELPEKVSLDFKRNLFLIYKEALNNIAKHSRAGRVQIGIRIDHNVLKLVLSDNGIGFDVKNTSQGNGLSGMRGRAQRIGATLHILSEPGRGCTLELEARIA